MNNKLLAILLILSVQISWAQEFQDYPINNSLNYQYKKPKLFDFITYLPKDMGDFGHSITHIKNTDALIGAVASTLILLRADQNLTNNAVTFGNNIGLSQHYTYSHLGPFEVVPKDINSGIYLSGNVFFVSVLSGSFLTYGKLKNDYRALNTSSELMEGLFAVALVTQTLKRITGRQEPEKASIAGGKWQFFPNLKTYQNNRAYYDAYPSGHVATLMTTITVLASNYPEKKWIKPVGYSMLGVLAVDMMQSQVHWASDYPLAIAIGYIIGKNVAKRRIKKTANNTAFYTKKSNYKLHYNLSLRPNYKAIGVTVSF